jgi:tetratricopeptide (TPR) repeat protein
MIRMFISVLSVIMGTLVTGQMLAQEQYKSFDDAMRKAGPLLSNREYAASQEPLEAALKLAPDDRARLRVYESLKPAYRLLPEIDKMLEATEFILRHTDHRDFLHQRGKLDIAIERYEKNLKDDPQDVAALSVLTVVFTRLRRDVTRGAELTKRLEEVDRAIASSAAARIEKEAETAPRMAATLLKNAAQAWLEAGDNAQALAAAKKSASTPAESQTNVLKFQWHDGLGDVFLKTGAVQEAVTQYEAAVAAAFSDIHRKGAEKKLEEARAALAKPDAT